MRIIMRCTNVQAVEWKATLPHISLIQLASQVRVRRFIPLIDLQLLIHGALHDIPFSFMTIAAVLNAYRVSHSLAPHFQMRTSELLPSDQINNPR